MKKSLKNISLKNLAGLVSKQLKKYGVDVVLTGGACVSIYSNNEYQSLDLDFVTSAVEYMPAAIKTALGDLKFKRSSEGFFERRDCPFIVEFIPPPLAIGREPVKTIKQISTRLGTLFLLGPTECVKDRLAAFYFWDDRQSLEQAKQVAKKQCINYKEVRRWSRVEGKIKKYNEFLKYIGKKKGKLT